MTPLVDALDRRFKLAPSLWDGVIHRNVGVEAMVGLPLMDAQALIEAIDYDVVRARAFVREPPIACLVGSPGEAWEHLAAGDSMLVDHAQQWLPDLADIEAELTNRFGLPPDACDIKLSISPPGSGLFTHFDQHDSIQVQLSGGKAWQISDRPGVVNPLHAFAVGTPPDPELVAYATPEELVPGPLADVTMRPGDVLTLPRGHWHGTTADGWSTGVAIRVGPPPRLAALRPELRGQVITNAAWRAPAYGLWGREEMARAAAQQLLDRVAETFPTEQAVFARDAPRVLAV